MYQATAVNLTPDYSIVVQVAIFLAVFLGLRWLVFDPVQRVLAERARRTVEALHTAEEMIAAAHADRARYDDAVRQRRLEMAREAEAARHAAIEESNREIAAARAAISRELAAHRAAVAAQVEAARRTLSAEAEIIAAEMLQRVTGRMRA
jgi:F-type H+-transporting ATPase subunit b